MESPDAVIVPNRLANDAFKAMGFSVFMVKANVGLAQLEVVNRSRHMTEVYWRWRKKPNGNISELLRELASVSDAVHKLDDAEKKR